MNFAFPIPDSVGGPPPGNLVLWVNVRALIASGDERLICYALGALHYRGLIDKKTCDRCVEHIMAHLQEAPLGPGGLAPSHQTYGAWVQFGPHSRLYNELESKGLEAAELNQMLRNGRLEWLDRIIGEFGHE